MSGQIIGPLGVLPAISAWTPASLGSALVAWYKADIGVTGTSPVTGWADQSGNSNNLVVLVGTTGPTFHATGLGGKESLGFVAAVNAMVTVATDTMTNMGTGNLSSCFVLGSLTTGTSSASLGYTAVGQGMTSAANSVAWFYTAAAPNFTWANNFANGTVQAVTASTEFRMGMVLDGTNGIPYLNNVAGTSNAVNFNFTSPGTLHIGAGAGGWDGEIREVIVTNTALSTGDRASLDAYLIGRQ